MRKAVGIPVIASSGAGCPAHFEDVFNVCGVEAGLAASIFHKNLVSIPQVKAHLEGTAIAVRPSDTESGSTGRASGECRCGPGCSCVNGSCGCATGACGCSPAECASARQRRLLTFGIVALAAGVAIGAVLARR